MVILEVTHPQSSDGCSVVGGRKDERAWLCTPVLQLWLQERRMGQHGFSSRGSPVFPGKKSYALFLVILL